MFRVLSCLGGEHDLRLVALAGVICFIASFTAVSLFHRARLTEGRVRALWILTAGIATGCGIWATHFVAMLSYEPGVATGYDIGLTAGSLVAAVVVTSVGLVVAVLGRHPWSAPAGGAVVGLGIACMHYLGMFALQLPGRISWQLDLVAASIVLGGAFGVAALALAVRRDDIRGSVVAALLLTLAIVSHHFTAMGAVEIVPDPTRVVDAWSLSPSLLVSVVTNSALLVLGLALASSYADRRLRDKDLRLATAMNNLSQGVVMFDAGERLVACNDRYIELYGLSPEVLKPGCTLSDVIRHRIATGSLVRDAEEYRATLVDAMKEGRTASWIVELNDGRSVSVINRPFAGGYWVGTHEDITERRQGERELERTKTFLNTIIENVPALLLVKDVRERKYVLINRATEEFFGTPRADMLGKKAHDVFPREQADLVTARDNEVLESGQQMLVENSPIQTPGRGTRIATSRRLAVRDNKGAPQYLLTVVEDVTERKRADDELRRTREFLNTVIENVPATIFVKDAAELRYVLVNRAGERYYGVSRDKLIGKTVHDIFPAATADFVMRSDRQLLESGEEGFTDQHAIETPGNGTRYVTSRRLPIRDENGKSQYLLGVIEDVTERKVAQERIAHMAHHDALTDLPNRTSFSERLAAMLDKAAKDKSNFAVLSIDLDRFKEVNDVFGHSVGDALLLDVSRRMQETVGNAFLARFGGDEFALIVADGVQPASAAAIAERLLALVAGDIEIEGHRLRIGISVGVAIYPNDGADATTLLANADAALYRAKEDGRGTIRFFEADMDKRLRERRAMQHELRSAVANGEITLHYQPQAQIDGAITGFEALGRWNHPTRGMVPPGVFIPLAEESGLIMSLGEWILREACREAASWPKPLQIAINLSPIQFRHGDLAGLVHAVLLETGLAPNRLELEITEGVLIGDFSRAVSILRRLKTLGVRIAMDDFGTGYSSLSYLQAFPFDKIKIDRGFVANLDRNSQSAAIIRAVIGLGRGLDLPVVAEGVETRDQLAFLAREACDEVQGYLVGRPAPIEAYADIVGHPRQADRTALAG
jgi:diguanylate cyclase (GGDEF)-like protein/PAS domain S-box-containing protein